MLTRMVCSVVALLLAAPAALAQTTQPTAQELIGTLTGSKVAVRSGPSTTGSYPCTRLGVGDKVTVLQSKGDWLQVKPVKGTWSVIAKKFVTPDAASKAGVVNADNVWVRAAGELCTFTAVTDFYVLQGQLNKNDKVEILGDSGDFYKITPPTFATTPPTCATFWIAAKYVDLGGKTAPTEIAKVGDGSVKVEMPSDGSTTQPVIIAEAPKQDAPVQPTLDPASVRGKIEAVRKDMTAEYAKPAEQRDLKRIIEKFKAIDTGDDKYAKQVVDYYTQYMDNQLKTIDEVASITKSIDANKAIVTKAMTDLNTREIASQTNPGPKAYNAEGVLKASGLFPGTKVTPKRWVVRDAYTDRITAYVQCTTGDLNI